MITFLRRLRRSVIDAGMTKNYVLYAIGEVTLVVIGILLALQINNWNEDKKNHQKFQAIFHEIAQSLYAEIEGSDDVLRFYSRKDSIFSLILKDQLNEEDYAQAHGIFNPTFALLNGQEVHINTIAYNNLISNIDKVPDEYGEVVKQIEILYEEDAERVMHNYGDIRDDISQMRQYLSQNHEWFSKILHVRLFPQAVDYFLNDPFYKNRVYGASSNIRSLWKAMNQYKGRAIQVLKLLSEVKVFDIEGVDLHSAKWMVDESMAKSYEGEYRIQQSDAVIAIKRRGSRLYMRIPPDQESELVPVDEHAFYYTQRMILLGFNQDEGKLTMRGSNGDELNFNKVSDL